MCVHGRFTRILPIPKDDTTNPIPVSQILSMIVLKFMVVQDHVTGSSLYSTFFISLRLLNFIFLNPLYPPRVLNMEL